MKTRIFLICMALSAAAWGAEPAADTPASADTTTAPATQDVKPAGQQAAPAAESEQTTPAAESKQKADTAAAQSGYSRGSVVRSVFTTGIKDREPVDKLSGKIDDGHVYYYTELRDMSGQTAIHRWQYNGKVVAEVKFKVRGPRWRVWSSKTIPSNDTGEWKVSVINGAGEVIAEDMIDYTGPAAAQKPATEEQPATEQKPAVQEQPAGEQAPAQEPATDSMSK